MIVTIATNNPSTEIDLKRFINDHPDITAKEAEMENMYDDKGNYKEVDLTKPGGAITQDYLDWDLAQAEKMVEEGKIITLEEFDFFLFDLSQGKVGKR